jgi:hypothetical protein
MFFLEQHTKFLPFMKILEVFERVSKKVDFCDFYIILGAKFFLKMTPIGVFLCGESFVRIPES